MRQQQEQPPPSLRAPPSACPEQKDVAQQPPRAWPLPLERATQQQVLARQPRRQEQEPRHLWLGLQPEYPWLTPVLQPAQRVLDSLVLVPPKLQEPAPVRARVSLLVVATPPPLQQLSAHEFLLKYQMWKAFSRPSRLTSRAEWQRIDSVDTLCPPYERTDSVNIHSD